MKIKNKNSFTHPLPSTKLKLKIASSNLHHDKKNHSNISNNNNNSNNNHHSTVVNDKSFVGISNFLPTYDRELDSDQEEPLGFEEQFILKIPNSTSNDEFKKFIELVKNRKEINSNQENIFFKFTDSRRGVFNIGNKTFPLKLVDLPCVIESQKTFDNKHLFKIADICQMILVEDTPITDDSMVTQGNFNIEDFIYPHGLTPPLHHVRKRRFRKRLNKRTIETVERAVERLLEEDSRADQVIIDIVDNVRDLSDSEGDDYQPPQSATIQFGNQPQSKIVYNKSRSSIISLNNQKNLHSPTVARHQSIDSTHVHQQGNDNKSGSHPQDENYDSSQVISFGTPFGDSIGAPTPAGEDFDDRPPVDYDDEGSIDSDLAAEIEAGLIESAAAEEATGTPTHEDGNQDDDSEDLFGDGDNDDDEDDEDEDDEDDEEETNEMIEDKQRIRLLQGELKDLELAITKKRNEIFKAGNLILKKRFEEALKKLVNEFDSKKNQLNSTQINLQNALQERKNQNLKSDQQQQQRIGGHQATEIELVTSIGTSSNPQKSQENAIEGDVQESQNHEDNGTKIAQSSPDEGDQINTQNGAQSQMDLDN